MKLIVKFNKFDKFYLITNNKRLATKICTAAFIDKNNKINTNILQDISQKIYNMAYEAIHLIYDLHNNNIIDNAILEINYQIINDIGLYGETFIDKHNSQVTIELQLGHITTSSEECATRLFDNATLQYSHQQQYDLYTQFENELDKIYYLAVILIQVDNTIKYEHHFFSRKTEITSIKQYIINYITEYKQQH